MNDEYRKRMDALASEAKMSRESVARIEQALLIAFAERRSEGLEPLKARKSFLRLPPTVGRTWAAAAAIVLIAGSIAVWRLELVTVNTVTPPSLPVAAATVANPLPPQVSLSKSVGPAVALRANTSRRPASPRGSRSAGVIRPSGFVQLPGAASLPAFESGEIVRMDVPVASLPAYGIDISSGAGKGPVEADLLIGQDGLARAIRLVKSTARSTQ
jgi:hypothetical protein